jgi:lipopolysaccharide export system permease protein
MPKLDRYLFREFTQSFLATLIILLMVSVGGVMADLLGKVADGRVPARLLLSQLGLQFLGYMPYILPLALMLGLLLAFSRLYRDSEMAVLTGTGIGPGRLLRPLLLLVVPVVLRCAPPNGCSTTPIAAWWCPGWTPASSRCCPAAR